MGSATRPTNVDCLLPSQAKRIFHPFLLIDDKSPLHAPDEASILKSIANPNTMGTPTRSSLTQALTHPNPAVRQSAANILKAMNP